MKKLILNSIKINIVLFGLFPILPRIVNVVIAVAFSILSLIFFIVTKSKTEKFNLVFINSSLYIIYLLSLIYTQNFNYASKHLLTSLSLIAFPVAFYLLKMTHFFSMSSIKKLFLKIYWEASVVYALLIYSSFFTFSNPRYPFKDANFFRKASASISLIGQHPIYTSLILSLAILIGLEYLFTKNKRFKFIVIIGEVMMLVLLILIMSRGVLLALLISIGVFIAFKIRYMGGAIISRFVLIGSMCIFVLLTFIPQKNNRFSQLFDTTTYINLNENNSTSIRTTIYKCAISKIKLAPFFGHGFGDVKDVLLSCYKNKASFMLKNRYNSHNQYLSIWLGMGLIGLLIFIYMLYYNFKIAFLTSNYLGFSILIFFVGVMFFENILERQTGVILFSFLLNFFGFFSTYEAEKIKKL